MLNELPGSTNKLPVGRVPAQFSEVARGGKFGFDRHREKGRGRRKGRGEKKRRKGRKEDFFLEWMWM